MKKCKNDRNYHYMRPICLTNKRRQLFLFSHDRFAFQMGITMESWGHGVVQRLWIFTTINDDMLSLYTRPITENSYPQILKTLDKPNIWPPWTDSMVFPFCCHIYIHPECINCCFTNRPVGEGSLAFAVISGFLECSVFCTPYLGHAPPSEPLSVSVKATIPKPARKSSDSTAPAATSSPRPASMSKSKSPRLPLYNPGVKGYSGFFLKDKYLK